MLNNYYDVAFELQLAVIVVITLGTKQSMMQILIVPVGFLIVILFTYDGMTAPVGALALAVTNG